MFFIHCFTNLILKFCNRNLLIVQNILKLKLIMRLIQLPFIFKHSLYLFLNQRLVGVLKEQRDIPSKQVARIYRWRLGFVKSQAMKRLTLCTLYTQESIREELACSRVYLHDWYKIITHSKFKIIKLSWVTQTDEPIMSLLRSTHAIFFRQNGSEISRKL